MDAFPPSRSLQSYDKEEAVEDDSSSDEEDEALREAIHQFMIDRRREEARRQQKQAIQEAVFDFKRRFLKKMSKPASHTDAPLDTDSTHVVEQAPLLENNNNNNKSFESSSPVKAMQETTALDADP